MLIYQTIVTTPMGPGDSITVTQDAAADSSVIVIEVSGLQVAPSFLGSANSNAAGSMQVDFVSPADGIILCSHMARAGTITDPIMGSWHKLIHLNVDCGGGNGLISGSTNWLPASAGESSCAPAPWQP